MFNERYNSGMEMFNLTHIITIIVCIGLFAVLFIFRKKLSGNKRADFIFRMCLATFMLVMEVTYHIWTYTTTGFDLIMIPIQVCAMSNLLTIIALFGNFGKIIKVTYYWAITGGLLSILFVDTTYMPPHFRFFHYFAIHFLFLAANIYFVSSGKVKLVNRDLYISSLILLCIAIVQFIIGFFTPTDWIFLRTSPVNEISDALGFPWYTILWVITVFAMFNAWHYLTKLCFYLGKSNPA